MSDQQRPPLRRVGAIWKPGAGKKHKGTGSVTIGGLKQRFMILPNDRKQQDTEPDYWLLSSNEPERDPHAEPNVPAAASDRGRPASGPVAVPTDDDIPF